MITNLVASIVVSLVTNTVTTDDAIYEQIPNPCPDKLTGCLVWHGYSNGQKIKDAENRIETSTIDEVTSLDISIDGKPHRIEQGRKYLFTDRKSFKLSRKWEEVGSKRETNSLILMSSSLFLTNGLVIGVTNISLRK